MNKAIKYSLLLSIALYPIIGVLFLNSISVFDNELLDILVFVILPVFIFSFILATRILREKEGVSRKSINAFIPFMFFSTVFLTPIVTKDKIAIAITFIVMLVLAYSLRLILLKFNKEKK